MIRTAFEIPTILVADRRTAKASRAGTLARAGVEVLGLPRTRRGFALSALLDELGRRGMTNVMVEGGSKTLGAFFDVGLADEVIVFVSRRLIGGQDAPSPLDGLGPREMSEVASPAWTKVSRCGEDDVYRLLLTDPASVRS